MTTNTLGVATAAVLLLLAMPSAAADPPASGVEEVTITATRDERATSEVPAAVNVVDPETLDQRPARLVSDLLRGEPGIFVQQTTGGQGIPIVRGLIGSRPGNRFNVPSPSLGPESVLGADVGVKLRGAWGTAEVFGFRSEIDDKIRDFPTGQTTPEGREIVIATNLGPVLLYGAEAGARVELTETSRSPRASRSRMARRS